MRAAIQLFPEIGLEETKFTRVKGIGVYNRIFPNNKLGGYWHDIQNRRNFFIEFAKKHNFDPLVAENWYNYTVDSFLGLKVCCVTNCTL